MLGEGDCESKKPRDWNPQIVSLCRKRDDEQEVPREATMTSATVSSRRRLLPTSPALIAIIVTVLTVLRAAESQVIVPIIVEPDPNAACNASIGSPDATCATCYKDDKKDYQVCCCSPYPALVTTEAVGGTSCSCSHKAGWALILMAILVPILIICDIMLICYCCYRGRCCFFSSTESEKIGYNVHNVYLADEGAQTPPQGPVGSPHAQGVQTSTPPHNRPF